LFFSLAAASIAASDPPEAASSDTMGGRGGAGSDVAISCLGNGEEGGCMAEVVFEINGTKAAGVVPTITTVEELQYTFHCEHE
jgi:hypothetical protein